MNRLLLFIVLYLLAFPVGKACADSQHRIDINNMIVVAANSPLEGVDTGQDMPMGQSGDGSVSLLPEEDGAPDDLFGLEGGYVHPYVSVAGAYTDNLFNVDSGKTNNFLTTISPGLWFSLPRTKIIPVTINPINTSPGGLQLQIDDHEGTDKYQLYALAGTDFLFYSEDSDLNTEDVVLEGLGRYNMASGLSLQVLDRYSLGHDSFGYGAATEKNQREFNSNLVMTTADWDLTEKVRLKVDYSNFYLNYNDSINDFLDRQDNSVDLYSFYKYSVKTSFFLEYRYVDVNYDTAHESDNKQNFYYGGVTWNTTDKLALLFKAGLQHKVFDDSGPGYNDKSNNLALDLQATYRFTVKTKAVVDVYRLNEESNSSQAYQTEVFGVRFGYTQEMTDKITGKFDFLYENSDYSQLVNENRNDDYYEFKPSIQYLFKEWLMGEVAYSYEVDNSSDNQFDYKTNTLLFSLNFAL